MEKHARVERRNLIYKWISRGMDRQTDDQKKRGGGGWGVEKIERNAKDNRKGEERP